MSFLKAAIAVCAVGAVGYVGYRAAKKHPKAAAAILRAMATPTPAPVKPATKTAVHIYATETVYEANKDKMEGAMGVTKRAKEDDNKLHIFTDGRDVHVVLDSTSVEGLEPIDLNGSRERFTLP